MNGHPHWSLMTCETPLAKMAHRDLLLAAWLRRRRYMSNMAGEIWNSGAPM